MKASEVIREARNVLFERGWHQGSLRGDDGSLCAVGALNAAAGDIGLMFGLSVRHLQHAIYDRCVPEWNDESSRTFDEIIDALEKAEKLALIAEESDAA